MSQRLEQQVGEKATITAKPTEAKSSVEYQILGITDKATALAFAVANIPTTDGGNNLDRIELNELEDERDGAWECTAYYVAPEDASESDPPSVPVVRELGFGFDIGNTSQKVTHSLETITAYAAPGETAPTDLKNAINVREGKPEGVDWFFGETSFNVEMEFPQGLLTQADIDALEAAQFHTNDATFRGRAAGEVMFMGARGSVRYTDPTSKVTYEFKVSKNATGLTIGPFTGVSKKGWEYVWIYSEKRETADGVFEQPVALIVERMADAADFSTLGVPT